MPGARQLPQVQIRCHPLTPERWPDLERLFGERGACAGCWCLWWRLPAAQWRAQRGEANRRALKQLVRAGPPPGLLAYLAGEPVGWCATLMARAAARIRRRVTAQEASIAKLPSGDKRAGAG